MREGWAAGGARGCPVAVPGARWWCPVPGGGAWPAVTSRLELLLGLGGCGSTLPAPPPVLSRNGFTRGDRNLYFWRKSLGERQTGCGRRKGWCGEVAWGKGRRAWGSIAVWGKQQQAVQPLTASRGIKLCEIGWSVSTIGVFEVDTGAKDTAAWIHQWRSTRLVLVDLWNPSGALWCRFIQAGGCTSHQNCPPGGEFQAKTPQDFSHPTGRDILTPARGPRWGWRLTQGCVTVCWGEVFQSAGWLKCFAYVPGTKVSGLLHTAD